MYGNFLKLMIFTFLESALNLGIFTQTPLLTQNSSPPALPKFLSSHPRKREITNSPRQHFFENLFPPTAETVVENCDLLYQNSIRKYLDDLEL